MIEHTFERDGVAITFRNTARQTLHYRRVLAAMPPGSDDEADMRTAFMIIAGYGVRLTGIKGLALPVSTDGLADAYDKLLDVVSFRWLDDAAAALLDLIQPLADDIQRPDATLTESESADPN